MIREATFFEDELVHKEDIYRRATFQNRYFYTASNISQQLPFQKTLFLRKAIFSRIYFSRELHCVKRVLFRSFPSPYFPAFGLNTERLSVSLRIQSKCRKMRIRITSIRTVFMQCYFFRATTFSKVLLFHNTFFSQHFFSEKSFFSQLHFLFIK